MSADKLNIVNYYENYPKFSQKMTKWMENIEETQSYNEKA